MRGREVALHEEPVVLRIEHRTFDVVPRERANGILGLPQAEGEDLCAVPGRAPQQPGAAVPGRLPVLLQPRAADVLRVLLGVLQPGGATPRPRDHEVPPVRLTSLARAWPGRPSAPATASTCGPKVRSPCSLAPMKLDTVTKSAARSPEANRAVPMVGRTWLDPTP